MKVVHSSKKQSLIDEFMKTPLQIGEEVSVSKGKYGIVTEISEDVVKVKIKGYKNSEQFPINKIIRVTRTIGHDPFPKNSFYIHTTNKPLDSILFELDLLPERKKDDYDISGILIKECNFNPYVYLDDGSKYHYQRPLCWTLEQKQLLIESIYNNVSCGTILVRDNTWEHLEHIVKSNNETELGFKDIIDGKQRLTTIAQFVNGEFVDTHGNSFVDLSEAAQYEFFNSMVLTYKEIKNVNDKQVLKEFLKVNYAGVPQDPEHIKLVMSMLEKLK